MLENKDDKILEHKLENEIIEEVSEKVSEEEAWEKDGVTILEEELAKETKEKKHSKMLPAIPVLKYLISKAKSDSEFSQRIALKKKSIEELFEYLLQEVKKKLAENKTNWLDDPVVYGIAEDYYKLDVVVIDKPKPTVHNTTPINTNRRASVVPAKVETPSEEQISIFAL